MSKELRPPTLPAFKEWQVICSALESGEQTILLRKGGIAEGREGFQWRHEGFFLFPTGFHQQLDGVRGERELSKPPGDNHGEIEIRLWADTILTARIDDLRRVEALAPHHIWTPEVVHERFQWGDQPGLNVAVLRVRRLAIPWRLQNADRRAFGGCRSWLDLPRAEWPHADSDSDSQPAELDISQAEPVLADSRFDDRLAVLRELLEVRQTPNECRIRSQ